jgi:hypothetical protein
MHAASLARFDPRHPPLALPPPMQAEAYAEAMNQAIADAVAAEAQRDAAVARVAELTRPPACDNAGHPIAEMIYARLLQDFPGIARNEHKAINIRLEMNSARTDLDGESMESNEAYCDDVEAIFGIEANEGATILRLAIDGGAVRQLACAGGAELMGEEGSAGTKGCLQVDQPWGRAGGVVC